MRFCNYQLPTRITQSADPQACQVSTWEAVTRQWPSAASAVTRSPCAVHPAARSPQRVSSSEAPPTSKPTASSEPPRPPHACSADTAAAPCTQTAYQNQQQTHPPGVWGNGGPHSSAAGLQQMPLQGFETFHLHVRRRQHAGSECLSAHIEVLQPAAGSARSQAQAAAALDRCHAGVSLRQPAEKLDPNADCAVVVVAYIVGCVQRCCPCSALGDSNGNMDAHQDLCRAGTCWRWAGPGRWRRHRQRRSPLQGPGSWSAAARCLLAQQRHLCAARSAATLVFAPASAGCLQQKTISILNQHSRRRRS